MAARLSDLAPSGAASSAPGALFNPFLPPCSPTRNGDLGGASSPCAPAEAAVGPEPSPGPAAVPHGFLRNEHYPEECTICGTAADAGVHQ